MGPMSSMIRFGAGLPCATSHSCYELVCAMVLLDLENNDSLHTCPASSSYSLPVISSVMIPLPGDRMNDRAVPIAFGHFTVSMFCTLNSCGFVHHLQ